MSETSDNPLIAGLLQPGAYDHPARSIRLVETHCAWVVLTGEFAYKIKKPVNFGFLDFSTLEKRRHYCNEEIRLNRRFAPQIYLDVVAIGGCAEHPRIGAAGPALEYAVRMRQFPANGLLSELAARGELERAHIDQLVEIIGNFHRESERAAPGSDYGKPDAVHHWVRENFEHIRPSLGHREDLDQLERIRRWSETEYGRLKDTLEARRLDGFVRECHGDLHLGNITLIDGQPTPFDCIEFNPGLRWIDVASEVAFLIMDLDDRGFSSFGHRFLNGYLQFTGDYAGLAVLPYYLVYRALVRAKVAILRRAQAVPGSEAFERATADYRQYARLAEDYLSPRTPALLVTHGLSGSGKSTIAGKLCETGGLIQVRSDIERKRLAGMAAHERSGSATGGGLYTAARTGQTYETLASLARTIVQAGYSAILDATFLQQAQRVRVEDLARELRVPFLILDCRAPDDELEHRILARAAGGRDASEADLAVLQTQRVAAEPLQPRELVHTLRVDSQLVDIDSLRRDINERCGLPANPGSLQTV